MIRTRSLLGALVWCVACGGATEATPAREATAAEPPAEAKVEAQAGAKAEARAEDPTAPAPSDPPGDGEHLVPAKVVPKELPEIYDESGDMKAALDAALADAKKTDRRVLTVFGGNWCTWCHKLHMLFTRDETIRKRLEDSFVVLKIDSNSNEKLIEDLGLKLEGVPYLAVLDGDGKILVRQETGSLEEGPRHDPTKVLAFLEQWSPPEQP